MKERGEAGMNELLGVARDAMAAGQVVNATVAVIELSARRNEATPVQLVDLLERSCVYGPRTLVDFVWDELGPFAYASWALALALRCAREDVARNLMRRGVTLLDPIPHEQRYRAIAEHEVSLSRFDLTRESPNLFLHTRDRTVCSEVFAPFTGMEQLIGGSFSTATNIAATCDAVGRLCDEQAFDDTVFADLLRAVVVRAGELASVPDQSQPEARGALMELAAHMLDLYRSSGAGGSYVELVVANLLSEAADLPLIRFLCERDSSVFFEALESFPWLERHMQLVCSLVPSLQPGTPSQNARLAKMLARGGFLDELKIVASWPQAITLEGLDAAIEAASSTGHAEISAWLLAERTRRASCDNSSQQGEEDDLSSLLL